MVFYTPPFILKTVNSFEELKPPSESYFIVRYSLSTLF